MSDRARDIDALNNAYELKSGKLDVADLIQRHASNVKTLRRKGMTSTESLDNFLLRTGLEFFSSKYEV